MKYIAEHISATERVSSDAERDSREVKLYAYLKAQIETDERVTYQALVTDIRNFGFFVDVEQLGMSGLVPLSAVRDDFFVFDPARGDLFGKRTRRSIKLGDQVQVQVYKVDSFKKQVDFQLARKEDAPSAEKRKFRSKSPKEKRSNRQPKTEKSKNRSARGRS